MRGSALSLQDELFQIRTGFRRQGSVILALIFKDLSTRLRSGKFGIIFVALEPLVYLSVISVILYLVGRTEFYGIHVFLFLPSGLIPFLVFRRSLLSLPKSVGKNDGLLDYPQVKPIDTVIAAFILQMFILFLACCLLFFLLWWFMDLVPPMPQPLHAIGLMALHLLGCFGLALFVAVYATLYEIVDRVIHLMRRPIIIISGVILPLNGLPAAAREVLAWNPLVHVVAYMRYYTLGFPLFPEADLGYVFNTVIVLLGIGFICYYANRFRLVQER